MKPQDVVKTKDGTIWTVVKVFPSIRCPNGLKIPELVEIKRPMYRASGDYCGDSIIYISSKELELIPYDR